MRAALPLARFKSRAAKQKPGPPCPGLARASVRVLRYFSPFSA